jgi:hypothetical protein
LDFGLPNVSRAAIALKYDDPDKPAPISESQLLASRRFNDNRPDLWSVFNRTQENLVRGGLLGRAVQYAPNEIVFCSTSLKRRTNG